MDQERDTTGNPKSSQNGRFWLENSPPDPRASRETTPGPPPETVASIQFQAIEPKDARALEAAADMLPTLFELPDRTPEALQKRRECSQYALHDEHTGPPASHVDPPSGNHSHLNHTGPNSPASSDSASFEAADLGTTPVLDNPESELTQATHDHGQKTAAYHEDAPTSWAENSKATFSKAALGTRSAVVLLVLMMVTLAFFSGRALKGKGQPTDEILISEANSGLNDSGEHVVVITEDVQIVDELASRMASDANRRTISSEIANFPPEQSEFSDDSIKGLLPRTIEQPSETDLPSYIADSARPNSTGSLGEPTARTLHEDRPADDMFAGTANAIDEQGVPPLLSSPGAVVAFRASKDTDKELLESSDRLPKGIQDRLNLNDGLRYSDTPHAIGNFLEILKTWEASDLR